MGTMEAATKHRRADAERNHSALLEAAIAIFAERGLDVSVAEIAKRAGVGQGTAFRHFPTKDRLILAVVRRRIGEVLADAVEWETRADGAEALFGFMAGLAEMQSRDRALFEAAGSAVLGEPEIREAHHELVAIVGRLLKRAQKAGEVRDDVGPMDVLLLVKAVSAAAEILQAIEPRPWRRYLDLVRDGLSPQGASRLTGRPPSRAQFERAMEAVAQGKTCGDGAAS
jgi:AcrR family transcriptional regulator